MILGDNRPAVIANIRNAAQTGDFYKKVELGDPQLTPEQSAAIIHRYLTRRGACSFRLKGFAARQMANAATAMFNRDTAIVGMEKVASVTGGAILTSNHFSPVDNTVVRHFARAVGKKRVCIVSQETNLAMPGILGFLMNYADVIPISDDMHYMQGKFLETLQSLVDRKEWVLIYPEQEMWFNYRKPRPPKRGAYYFASRMNVPVICCFVEMRDIPELDTPEFHKVRYTIHILDVLTPDPAKSVRENSLEMCRRDYALKKRAYEEIYGKPLDYTFADSDIAGWLGSKAVNQ